MYLGRIFKFLKENEIVGCESWNTLVTWLRGLRSASPYIELNPNASGGMSIDLDVESLKNVLEEDATLVELNHSFKATLTNSTLSVSSGTCRFGRREASVSSNSWSVSNSKTVFVRLTKSSGGSITGTLQYGTPQSHMIDTSTGTMEIPICTTTGDDHKVKYYHIGDFNFANEPHIWWSGWDATAQQFASHSANGVDMLWDTPSPCDE